MNGFFKPPQKIDRPPQLILIACLQFTKATILLTVAAWLWISPATLPNSQGFTDMLFIAAHGRDVSGFLVPLFGVYVAYVGYGLWQVRRQFRRNLAISSAITISVSLQRLGLFGQPSIKNPADRETLYILILLDLVVYLYLSFHPEIARTFKAAR